MKGWKRCIPPSSKILALRLLFFSILSIAIRSYYCCYQYFSIRISEFQSCIIEENMESPYGFFYSLRGTVTSFLSKSRPSNSLSPRRSSPCLDNHRGFQGNPLSIGKALCSPLGKWNHWSAFKTNLSRVYLYQLLHQDRQGCPAKSMESALTCSFPTQLGPHVPIWMVFTEVMSSFLKPGKSMGSLHVSSFQFLLR